ncbi:hypothetical protein [Oscillibacter sp.]|uniref:hypothetical protein n=1 Tax=Oscillibacter sp. TaxID=1945593 RepID=UPI00289C87A0|nr:hypothetical protein [Oscillibacter sp.]
MGEIYKMILSAKGKRVRHHDNDDDCGSGGNSDTMIVDAACAPSNIRYPQDASLLNEAWKNSKKQMDQLHNPADGRTPRTYRTQARLVQPQP